MCVCVCVAPVSLCCTGGVWGNRARCPHPLLCRINLPFLSAGFAESAYLSGAGTQQAPLYPGNNHTHTHRNSPRWYIIECLQKARFRTRGALLYLGGADVLVQLLHVPGPLFQIGQTYLQPAPSAAQLGSLLQPPSLAAAATAGQEGRGGGGGGGTEGQSDPHPYAAAITANMAANF